MNLRDYLVLGRSGLRVSRLALGTMTFGTEWGWGIDEAAARSLFDRYVECGGNFVDTADVYTGGTSETWVGKLVKERRLRDKLVLATKFSFNVEAGNPNAGGNGRKNLYRALDASLRRLGTDYVDLYWVHCWDMSTSIEEVASTLTDLVRAGKVRAIGLSDVPAWYAARWQTLAERHGWEKIAALQLEYSLVERSIEREHIPMARELGMGVLAWGPLAGGLLSGKYTRETTEIAGSGRLDRMKGNPLVAARTAPSEARWQTVLAVKAVAEELGCSAAEVALAWILGRPGTSGALIGATKIDQLDGSSRALALVLPEEARRRLDEVSALDVVHPYGHFRETFQKSMIDGGDNVQRTAP